MENRSLLFGIIGFLLGGLLVSIAATTFDKPESTDSNKTSEMAMNQMTDSLKTKSGDDYDEAFVAYMIEHHQAAVDMAKLSTRQAKHQEVKTLSNNIISTQESEIREMKHWQSNWGYADDPRMNMSQGTH